MSTVGTVSVRDGPEPHLWFLPHLQNGHKASNLNPSGPPVASAMRGEPPWAESRSNFHGPSPHCPGDAHGRDMRTVGGNGAGTDPSVTPAALVTSTARSGARPNPGLQGGCEHERRTRPGPHPHPTTRAGPASDLPQGPRERARQAAGNSLHTGRKRRLGSCSRGNHPATAREK